MEYPEKSKELPKQSNLLQVWLVDDDIDLCEAYYEYLSDFFCVSQRFQSSREALETLRKSSPQNIPDLVIVDRLMPEMDGLSLSKEIAKLRLPVAILMVSGDEHPVSEDEAESLNIIGMLQKPCSPVAILKAIQNYGSFKKVCESIWSETLNLCRRSIPDWEFFLGHHADIEKAFHAPTRKKASVETAIRHLEAEIRERSIRIPPDSNLLQLLEEFRKMVG